MVEVIDYHIHQPMLTTSVPLSDTGTNTQFAPEYEFDLDTDTQFAPEYELDLDDYDSP